METTDLLIFSFGKHQPSSLETSKCIVLMDSLLKLLFFSQSNFLEPVFFSFFFSLIGE